MASLMYSNVMLCVKCQIAPHLSVKRLWSTVKGQKKKQQHTLVVRLTPDFGDWDLAIDFLLPHLLLPLLVLLLQKMQQPWKHICRGNKEPWVVFLIKDVDGHWKGASSQFSNFRPKPLICWRRGAKPHNGRNASHVGERRENLNSCPTRSSLQNSEAKS